MRISKVLMAVSLALFAAQPAAADGELKTAPKDHRSGNYDKGSNDLLPGEEVVTPTGQKIKVWSTKGPVEVSPPPQPFDDPAKQVVPEVIIDGNDHHTHRKDSHASPTGAEDHSNSFDFRNGEDGRSFNGRGAHTQ